MVEGVDNTTRSYAVYFLIVEEIRNKRVCWLGSIRSVINLEWSGYLLDPICCAEFCRSPGFSAYVARTTVAGSLLRQSSGRCLRKESHDYLTSSFSRLHPQTNFVATGRSAICVTSQFEYQSTRNKWPSLFRKVWGSRFRTSLHPKPFLSIIRRQEVRNLSTLP
jgi:hypothetical protein